MSAPGLQCICKLVNAANSDVHILTGKAIAQGIQARLFVMAYCLLGAHSEETAATMGKKHGPG